MARPLTKRTRAEEVMHLAVVACGNRLDETLTMVKSALLFSLKRITFHIFAEDPLAPQFEERVRNPPPTWRPNMWCKKAQNQMLGRRNLYTLFGLFSTCTSLVSPLAFDLIQCVLNIPSRFVIDDIKIRAVLTLPLWLTYNPFISRLGRNISPRHPAFFPPALCITSKSPLRRCLAWLWLVPLIL